MGECKVNSACNTAMGHEQKSTCCGKLTDNIRALANDAWAELLKNKIKKQYENKIGAKMDKIAEVAADVAIEYWKHKVAAKELCKEHNGKLSNVIKAE